jgi:hypothetical protein
LQKLDSERRKYPKSGCRWSAGAETGEVRVQEEAIRLQRGLLQRREKQINVQANRIAELEMIGLRTSAVSMLMIEPFTRQ